MVGFFHPLCFISKWIKNDSSARSAMTTASTVSSPKSWICTVLRISAAILNSRLSAKPAARRNLMSVTLPVTKLRP